MATMHHQPERSRRLTAVAAAIRQAFWVLALGLIACYAFFVALGAFSPGDVGAVSGLVGALAVLWLLHAWAGRRAHLDRDPRLRYVRERRGF